MRRTSSFLFAIGGFLLVSLLWPYEPAAPESVAFLGATTYNAPERTDPDIVLQAEDLWQGAMEKTLYDRPFGFPAGLGERQLFLEVAPGARVPPGTRWLNVTTEARTYDGNPPDLGLWVTTADDHRRLLKADPDAVVSWRILEEWNDWSPDPDTRWRFVLTTSQPSPITGRLRIDVARNGDPIEDLRVPDRWNGRESVRVFEARSSLWDVSPTQASPYGSSPPAAPRLRLQPPVDVDELVVHLRYNSTTPSELHYQPILAYRGADREPGQWERQALPPMEAKRQAQNGYFLWRLPVEPRMWDSPFAESTRWHVSVNWYGDVAATPTMMMGNYHFTIDAKRDPPRE